LNVRIKSFPNTSRVSIFKKVFLEDAKKLLISLVCFFNYR